MNDTFFIALIGLLGIISSIISSKGGLHDRKYKWYRKIRPRGWIVVTLGFLILGLTIWQSIKSESEKNKKEVKEMEERHVSDSTITARVTQGVEINSKKLYNDLSDALGKQQLKLDTVSKTIINLRNSGAISEQLAETILTESKKQNDHLLSAGSFCYLYPNWIGRGKILEFYLIHHGEYPINNLEITAIDSAYIKAESIKRNHPKSYPSIVKEATSKFTFPIIYPGYNEFLYTPTRFIGQGEMNYSILINSNAGLFYENVLVPEYGRNEDTEVTLKKDGLEIPIPFPYK
jgi:hypothetical protein